jgi:solute:Na+ symporter, SSS family
MSLSTLDLVVIVLFTVVVVTIALRASRKEDNAEDYFLAGRRLTWWLIGFSLIASNISTEHFVGMAGRGYELGLAIASYEWMAAVTLVIVALFFLPRFLRAGIYTIPEYLEYRYSRGARTLMAVLLLVAYVVVSLASVLYAGAIAIQAIFGLDLIWGIWIVAVLAGIYSVYGGLAAVVWSDLLQSIALLIGGVIVTILGFRAIGGWEPFAEAADGRLSTVLPWNHPEMPWVAVFIGGLWIPNLFYWGLNQFITQRTLGARSLSEGQRGIILAAFLKLLIPFIIVFPGIMAAQLFPAEIGRADAAYPVLMRELLPDGLRGFMFAALLGAVVSTLDSVLNSAATIFTMDVYRPYIRPAATPKQLVRVGRIATLTVMVIGGLWAPAVAGFEGVFTYIQMVWGFISPGIVAAFLFGLLWKRVPAAAAIGGMILGAPVYGALLWFLPGIAFLHHMAITFIAISLFIVSYTLARPMTVAYTMPQRPDIALETEPAIRWLGGGVILATITLYVIFW